MMLMASSAAWADYYLVNGIRYDADPYAEPARATVIGLEEGKYSGDIVIPATVTCEGVACTVSAIDGQAFYQSDITSVNIPGTVEMIPYEAFRECPYLTSVVMNEGTKIIEYNAFLQCTELSSVTLPKGLEYLYSDAFHGTALTSVSIPGSVKDFGTNVFQDCAALTTVTIGKGVKYINSYMFQNCTALTSVTLPEGLEYINGSAFENCSALTSITLPESLQYIDGYAFTATGLTSITIPGNVRGIGSSAFAECPNLTSVNYTYTATFTGEWSWTNDVEGQIYVAWGAFENSPIEEIILDRPWYIDWGGVDYYPNLTKVTFGSHLTAIPQDICHGIALESLTIGANVTEIGDRSFEYCTLPEGYNFPFAQMKKIGIEAFRQCNNLPYTLNLTSIEELGDNAFYDDPLIETVNLGTVKKMGSGVFSGCTNLATLTIAEGAEDIGDWAFPYLPNLATVSLPSTLKRIGGSAFYYCENLTSATLPASLTEIGGAAFENCPLTEVTIPAGVTKLEGSTFYGSAIKTITIPATLNELGYRDFANCQQLTDIRFEYSATPLKMSNDAFTWSDNIKTVYVDRNIADEEYSGLSFGYAEKVTFTEHVTSIPNYFLSGMSNLKEVTMTDNVTRIGIEAFYGTRIEKLTLSNKLETIGDRAFQGADALETSYTFPFTVKAIGEDAFFTADYYDAKKLLNVYVPWIEPLKLKDENPGDPYNTMFRYNGYGYDEKVTLWVPGGTMDAYKNAYIWKRFNNFEYWSYVVNAAVTGKGSVKIANGQTVTDNGTNTDVTATGTKFNDASEGVSGLFVREKDITLTPTPARGYELTALTANGTDIKSAAKMTNLLADQTIAATFTPIIYKVTYDLSGGALAEGQENPATYTVEDDVITLKNPTRTGYTFEGWIGTGLESATKTATIAKNSIGDRSFTATWKPITYNLAYDLGGGSVSTANTKTYTIETANFTLVNPTKTGYTFTGWTGTDLTEKTMTVTITKGHYGDRSFTATYEANPYKVRFNKNGGDGEMADMNLTYDETAKALTTNAFTRTAYNFKGWNTKADGTGTAYTDKQAVKNLTTTRDAVVTLYAQWEAISYTITYDLADGALATGDENPANYTVESAAITLKNPERDGYMFLGWTGTALTEATMTVTIAKGSTGNHSYTATWKKIVLGDVNDDGVVDISDYIGVANHILGNTPAGFNLKAADVNNDNEIDISDYIGVANIILTGKP